MMPRHLNPQETALFTADMSRLPPEHGSDVALKWRERCINLIHAMHSPALDGLAILEAGAYAGAIAYWDGVNEAKRDELVLTWQTKTAPELKVDPKAVPEPFQDVFDSTGKLVHKALRDPRTLGSIPVHIYPTAVLALTGAFGTGGPTYNRFFMAPAVAGVGYAVGSFFRDMAYKRALEKQAAAIAAATTTTTQTGGEGNPYRGFPRAA